MWCISIYHMIGLKQTWDIKNFTLKAAKKIVGVVISWEECLEHYSYSLPNGQPLKVAFLCNQCFSWFPL